MPQPIKKEQPKLESNDQDDLELEEEIDRKLSQVVETIQRKEENEIVLKVSVPNSQEPLLFKIDRVRI